MRFNKRSIISLLLIGVMCVGIMTTLTACGGSSSGGGSGLKMLYVMNPLDDFRGLILDNLKSVAESEGVSLDVTEECQTVDEQINQIKQAASGGYDAIICLPVDSSTALQLEIAAGDLPIIYVNTMPSTDHLKPDKYMYVGSYEWDAGRFQAEYVWDKLGKPKSLNAIIFMGEQGHAGTIGRTGAVKQFFRDNGVDANFVFCDYATWSDEIAADKFDIFMKTHQTFDAVFCNNDTMAMGVVKAFKKYGFSFEDIPICGVDATAAGCQSIVDGEMQFTVCQSAAGQAEMCIKTAEAILKDGSATDVEGVTDDHTIVWVPFEPVNASNVKNYQ